MTVEQQIINTIVSTQGIKLFTILSRNIHLQTMIHYHFDVPLAVMPVTLILVILACSFFHHYRHKRHHVENTSLVTSELQQGNDIISKSV